MSDFWVLFVAIARDWTRDRIGLFFSFAFPLVFLLAFGLLFKDQSYEGKTFITSAGPGVLCWAVANGSLFWAAYWVVEWRDTGVFRLVRLSPVRVRTLLGARYALATASGLVQALFFVLVACLPFLGLQLRWTAVIAIIPLLAGIFSFLGIGLLIGLVSKSAGSVTAIGNLVILPMAFLSGTFFPIQESPLWLQNITQAFPLRHMIDSVGPLMTGGAHPQGVVLQTLALLGFTAVFGALAVRSFRWDSSEPRERLQPKRKKGVRVQ